MAQVRTAKGTNSSKASATSLSINDVTLDYGAGLVVCLGYENSQGDPTSVQFGNRGLSKQGVTLTNGDFSLTFWAVRGNRVAAAQDIVATWGAAITARAMFATQIMGASAKDVQQGRTVDATANMNTGVAAETTTVANTIHLAAFVSRGPSGDTTPSASYGHAIGQRVGTTGDAATTNVTICETYETLTAIGDCRAAVVGATARDWCAGVIAFKETYTYTITDCYRRRWVTDTDSDTVIVRLTPQDPWYPFEIRLDTDLFDGMTDEEFTSYISKGASWHIQHKLDGPLATPEVDTSRDTRMASFVNDTIAL